MTAEQKRNKRRFRHQMQAQAQVSTVCKQFMTNRQLQDYRKVLVDRFFSYVKSQAKVVTAEVSNVQSNL